MESTISPEVDLALGRKTGARSHRSVLVQHTGLKVETGPRIGRQVDDRNDRVTDIFFFRASAYIMMSPLFIVAAYALIKSIEMARNKVRSWIAAWEQRRYHELAEMPQMPQMPQIRSETGGV